MRRVYAPISDHLAAVDARLRRELQSRYEAIAPVLRHGTQLGGKRLRPALLLLSAVATEHHLDSLDAQPAPGNDGDTIRDDHITMATVIEMVHTATLVHDDVLDKAATRRHTPTINAKWDSDTSILLGDYLFAQSFSLAATLSSPVASTQACRWVGQAAQQVCEGELRQILSRDHLGMDEQTYLDILRGKTAELTSVSCRLGCSLSGGDPELAAALSCYGNDLGIAFQIADDYLDLWGDADEIGKTLGTDLIQGKLTLPLIRLLHSGDAALAAETQAALQAAPAERLARVLPLLSNSDAAEYTRGVANRFRRSAISAIEHLRPSPALDSLIEIAHFSVARRI
ncbi:polyprenyl synthetase family protein [Allorhodopirellula solitaria]